MLPIPTSLLASLLATPLCGLLPCLASGSRPLSPCLMASPHLSSSLSLLARAVSRTLACRLPLRAVFIVPTHHSTSRQTPQRAHAHGTPSKPRQSSPRLSTPLYATPLTPYSRVAAARAPLHAAPLPRRLCRRDPSPGTHATRASAPCSRTRTPTGIHISARLRAPISQVNTEVVMEVVQGAKESRSKA